MRVGALGLLVVVAAFGCASAELHGDLVLPTPTNSGTPTPTDSGTPTATPTPTPVGGPACPVDATLVACYAFEGNANDGSANALNLTATGASYSAGVDGQALTVSAASELSVPHSAVLAISEVTMEAWINALSQPAAATRRGVADKDMLIGMFQTPTGISCVVGLSSVAQSLTVGTWTHVACRFDGSAVRIFVNGNSGASAGSSLGGGTGPLHVGENAPIGDDQFLGAIDRLRIWNTARTDVEICTEAGTC